MTNSKNNFDYSESHTHKPPAKYKKNNDRGKFGRKSPKSTSVPIPKKLPELPANGNPVSGTENAGISAIRRLEQNIGYTFKQKSLLKEALTHSSYRGENTKTHNQNHNERLEFLGDSVLSLIVSEYLYLTLKIPEGKLSKIRAALVCENSLYENASKMGLDNAIMLGKGERKSDSRGRRSILADAFEALIAAVYLDGGIEQTKKFLFRFLPNADDLNKIKERDNAYLGDYKTSLQEIVQRNSNSKIAYNLVREEGMAHNRIFYVNVTINGKIVGEGCGKSKKSAEQTAAKNALGTLNAR
jgi:ribonuclease-3